jgi:Protein of unknown function (DUF3768)
MDSKTARIRALNDELRQNFAGGAAVMTPGIAALGAEAVARIVKTVAVFDDFCHANDPHEEHELWRVRCRRPQGLFQDRLLRRHPHLPLPRSSGSIGHQARDHDHAGRRVLRLGLHRTAVQSAVG